MAVVMLCACTSSRTYVTLRLVNLVGSLLQVVHAAPGMCKFLGNFGVNTTQNFSQAQLGLLQKDLLVRHLDTYCV